MNAVFIIFSGRQRQLIQADLQMSLSIFQHAYILYMYRLEHDTAAVYSILVSCFIAKKVLFSVNLTEHVYLHLETKTIFFFTQTS